jgi:hypothetical protein
MLTLSFGSMGWGSVLVTRGLFPFEIVLWYCVQQHAYENQAYNAEG